MHHDKKVGLGLAILLIGIVGAFFFRNEPTPSVGDIPELASADVLDREINDPLNDGPTPYTELDEFEARYRPGVKLEGIELGAAEDRVPPSAKLLFDEEYDFLNEPGPQPVQQPAGPAAEPIPFRREGEAAAKAVAEPADTRAVSQSQPKPAAGQPANAKPAATKPSDNSAVTQKPGQKPAPAGTPAELPAEIEMFSADVQPAPEGAAAAAKPAAPKPRTYTVQSGDTLSEISTRMLGSQVHYRKIFEANREILRTPDDLRPGMVLTIPELDGQRERAAAPNPDNATSAVRSRIPERVTLDGRTPATVPVADTAPPKPQPAAGNAGTSGDQKLFTGVRRNPLIPRRTNLQKPSQSSPAPRPSAEAEGSSRPVSRQSTPARSGKPEPGLPTLEGLEPLPIPE